MRDIIYPVPSLPVPAHPPPPLEALTLEVKGVGDVSAWRGASLTDRETRPRVLFFHGNGENLETMRRVGLFERLDALGVSFLAIDYPGYGRSDGSPSEERLLQAAEAALDRLRDEGGTGPVVLCGWSLGAAVAVAVGARRPDDVEGLMVLSAWTSLADVATAHFPAWLTALALRERYDSLKLAPGLDLPTLVVHGSRDAVIPVEQGRRLAAALPQSRWVEVGRAGHNDLMAASEVGEEMALFLGRLGDDRSRRRSGPGP